MWTLTSMYIQAASKPPYNKNLSHLTLTRSSHLLKELVGSQLSDAESQSENSQNGARGC